jgi:molecular chaperone GrpE (heat shock protein)
MDKKKNVMKIDFSQESIQKAVTAKIIQHPVSTYSIALGTIGLAASLLLFPGSPLLIASLCVLGIGVGSTAINFAFRRKTLEGKHLSYLNKLIDRQKQLVLSRLKRELSKFSSSKDLKVFSDQAVKQYEMIRTKFENFKRILSEKFDVSEITYARFFGTTEQLYLSVLDNLEDIMNSLETISNIDETYIEERLNYLTGLKEPEDADLREIETLTVRRELKKKQSEHINELLTINEEAMTQIDISMSAISRIKTKMGRASIDMESARKDLEELINRTKKYSIK